MIQARVTIIELDMKKLEDVLASADLGLELASDRLDGAFHQSAGRRIAHKR